MVGAQLPIEVVNWLTRFCNPEVKSAGIVIAQVIYLRTSIEIKQATSFYRYKVITIISTLYYIFCGLLVRTMYHCFKLSQ